MPEIKPPARTPLLASFRFRFGGEEGGTPPQEAITRMRDLLRLSLAGLACAATAMREGIGVSRAALADYGDLFDLGARVLTRRLDYKRVDPELQALYGDDRVDHWQSRFEAAEHRAVEYRRLIPGAMEIFQTNWPRIQTELAMMVKAGDADAPHLAGAGGDFTDALPATLRAELRITGILTALAAERFLELVVRARAGGNRLDRRGDSYALAQGVAALLTGSMLTPAARLPDASARALCRAIERTGQAFLAEVRGTPDARPIEDEITTSLAMVGP